MNRRRFLAAGASTAGLAAVGATGFAVGQAGADPSPTKGVEPFYGPHQAGIATAAQDRLFFAAYDVTTSRPAELVSLLRAWTDAAALLTRGLDLGTEGPADAPPADTGEAGGLDPAHLTLTFGFGPGIFTRSGADRFGLASLRPAALADLPAFPGDALDPGQSGGDLCVQACSNDPQVAYHAVRNLTRIARGKALLRWTQQGFGRTASTTPDQDTPRNLMGFKDGTNNLRSGTDAFERNVWARAEDGQPWMAGGSYLVVRRIRMHIEVWDRSPLNDQEATIGRTKAAGAPLGKRQEFDGIDLAALPADAHVRLANQDATAIHFLRRGYSFTDGIKPGSSQLDAGLFFLAYQRDPRTQFVPMQDTLARKDALNEYIQHVSSALFAIPPGVPGPGHFVGETLFS